MLQINFPSVPVSQQSPLFWICCASFPNTPVTLLPHTSVLIDKAQHCTVCSRMFPKVWWPSTAQKDDGSGKPTSCWLLKLQKLGPKGDLGDYLSCTSIPRTGKQSPRGWLGTAPAAGSEAAGATPQHSTPEWPNRYSAQFLETVRSRSLAKLGPRAMHGMKWWWCGATALKIHRP